MDGTVSRPISGSLAVMAGFPRQGGAPRQQKSPPRREGAPARAFLLPRSGGEPSPAIGPTAKPTSPKRQRTARQPAEDDPSPSRTTMIKQNHPSTNDHRKLDKCPSPENGRLPPDKGCGNPGYAAKARQAKRGHRRSRPQTWERANEPNDETGPRRRTPVCRKGAAEMAVTRENRDVGVDQRQRQRVLREMELV